jgi:valyl-tRNA synthetase
VTPLGRQPAAFLHDLASGEAYQAEAPTLWDVTYQTAVAFSGADGWSPAG